jgi:hypothetical protein
MIKIEVINKINNNQIFKITFYEHFQLCSNIIWISASFLKYEATFHLCRESMSDVLKYYF